MFFGFYSIGITALFPLLGVLGWYMIIIISFVKMLHSVIGNGLLGLKSIKTQFEELKEKLYITDK